ncbi:endonuclease/exonuclease/phosphatase family protein [Mesorhizobium sp. B2-2-4]|uniref:endonuclease/exonuclease/phosphatase family protein n=1 Tax=unclassified Mesorhizobium TaxID=325217 RepID=UPI0011295D44|nr:MULTISPECIES: endonuclease/exonuclease/phosphatase family protein [unclassified Mesorhizobium]TPM51916.1 endonuclease/exonuclease/phosphatase family protein [Mesorhizobium sp. B2-2-4]TPM60207.1 endonuclease/exonuclease/phosphatase family protein [Mesorhizobium sp. B2-2-1]TPN66161.1 endonuclease/exonuclease/phosphatase family protein [Mesorhizobium sp. B1-1-3]
MKLVSYNIQYGFGSDGLYDPARAARIVAGADIIALQEVERHWQRSNFDDQPELLSRLLPDYHWVYGPAFDMDASEQRDGRIVNRRRQFGTMVLSKLPIVWSRLHALPMRRTLRPLNTRNAALECMIRTPAGPVRVLSLHLAHVAVEERLEQIDYLLAEHRRAPSDGGPWSGADDEPARNWSNGEPEPENPLAAIWMGDFNMEPGSAEYRRIVGGTPYHRGAAYLDGFVDAAAVAIEPADDFHTHEKIIDGRLAKRRLDHCFVGGLFAGRVRSVSSDIGEVASDHFPVRIDIDLETPAGPGGG